MALSSHDKDIPFPIFGGRTSSISGDGPIQNKGFTEFCRRINRGLWEEERGKKDRKLPTPPRDSRGINGGVGKTQL